MRLIALLILLNVISTAHAVVITVNSESCSQPNFFCDIQAAIDTAQPGDIVVLVAGEYDMWQESVTIGKSLTLRGQNRDKTVLLGEGKAPSALINIMSTAAQVRVENLTIKDRVVSGSAAMGPGGLDHSGGDLTLENVRFHNNRGGWGGAVRIDTLFGEVRIIDCVFDSNAGFAGGGVAVYNGSALELSITDTEFRNNNAVFSGGAFLMRDIAEVSLQNLLVINNRAGNTGGGGHIFTDTGSTAVRIVASEFRENSAAKVGGLSSLGNDVSVALETSRFVNNHSRNGDRHPDCGGVGIVAGKKTTITQFESCAIKE